MKAFDLLRNHTNLSPAKIVRSSENPEKLKINRNSENPDHRKIQAAQKSSATKATSGGGFKSFIGGK